MRAAAVPNRCPSAYQPNALPLGQTGSQPVFWVWRRPFSVGIVLGDRVGKEGKGAFAMPGQPWRFYYQRERERDVMSRPFMVSVDG